MLPLESFLIMAMKRILKSISAYNAMLVQAPNNSKSILPVQSSPKERREHYTAQTQTESENLHGLPFILHMDTFGGRLVLCAPFLKIGPGLGAIPGPLKHRLIGGASA